MPRVILTRGVFCAMMSRGDRSVAGGTRELEFVERFWSKVVIAGDDECWVWTRAITESTGYGKFKLNGKAIDTHRVAWILTNGEIPEGQLVCHSCDNRACCNPSHLFLGTYRDNMQDCSRKGRIKTLRGEMSPQAKLNQTIVAAIRSEYVPGVFGYKKLAAKYKLDHGVIGHIIRQEIW